MAKVKLFVEEPVTIRVQIGGWEVAATGPRAWVEKSIEKFIEKRRADLRRAELRGSAGLPMNWRKFVDSQVAGG